MRVFLIPHYFLLFNHRIKLFWVLLCVVIINFTSSNVYKHSGSDNDQKITTLNGSDAKGYYEYLEWAFSGKNINYESENSYTRGNGKILKYTYGTSLFQAPFYILAQVVQPKKLNPFAFTIIDDIVISLGASIYIALALFMLFKLLLKFCLNQQTALIVTLCTYLGTNLFYYSSIEFMMSHLYSFLSITSFYYFVLEYLDSKRKKDLWLSLVFIFLIIAIRPINGIVVLPLVLYVMFQTKSLAFGIYSFISIFLAFGIQIVCWKLQCGQWTIQTYDGEGFYWLKPQLINVLFSFRKGLFIYTPILVLGVVGFYFLKKQLPKLFYVIVTTFLIYLYVVACWWHWPYGDSFSHRAFIDIYALFAIGIASLLSFFRNNKTLLHTTISSFVILNLFQTWQFCHFIISPEYMTFEKYKTILFATNNSQAKYIGGQTDIFPFKTNYTIIKDSIKEVDMQGIEYSQAIVFSTKELKGDKCYFDIEYTKIEEHPLASKDASLFIQVNDTLNKKESFNATLINNTTNDYLYHNTKSYSRQIELKRLNKNSIIKCYFVNPKKKNFKITDFKIAAFLFDKTGY